MCPKEVLFQFAHEYVGILGDHPCAALGLEVVGTVEREVVFCENSLNQVADIRGGS